MRTTVLQGETRKKKKRNRNIKADAEGNNLEKHRRHSET